MASHTWKRIVAATVVLVAVLPAQQPAAPASPRFEVVSIREVPPNAAPVMREQNFTPVLPGGQYVDSRASLIVITAFAYNMKNMNVDTQLVGLPNWAKNRAYAIAAKPAEGFPALPPGENQEQVRLMMRAMLAERFHLQLHSETRQEPILNLVVAKDGIKIREVDPPVPPAMEGHVGAALGDNGGRMIGNKSTMAGIAIALAIFLQRPVVDKTGLKAYYDFDVKWSAPETPDGRPPSAGLGPDGTGLLISTLQNQFGLLLMKTRGPVQYWVVDHIEPPKPN